MHLTGEAVYIPLRHILRVLPCKQDENIPIIAKFVPGGKLSVADAETIAPMGNSPTFLSMKQMREVVPLWQNMSVAIFKDKEANEVRFGIARCTLGAVAVVLSTVCGSPCKQKAEHERGHLQGQAGKRGALLDSEMHTCSCCGCALCCSTCKQRAEHERGHLQGQRGKRGAQWQLACSLGAVAVVLCAAALASKEQNMSVAIVKDREANEVCIWDVLEGKQHAFVLIKLCKLLVGYTTY
jgi:hypothetical protein